MIYKQEFVEGYIYRTFETTVDIVDMQWHFDDRNRFVEILSGDGWYFQFDNELPMLLEVGQLITIPKNVYHRISKVGVSSLIVKIQEYD